VEAGREEQSQLLFFIGDYEAAASIPIGATLTQLEAEHDLLPAAFYQVFAANLCKWMRAPTAQITSGGRTRPDRCWLGLAANEHWSWETGGGRATLQAVTRVVCLESLYQLAGGSPVVVIAREPRSKLLMPLGDWGCESGVCLREGGARW
jgi:hypothetical protein